MKSHVMRLAWLALNEVGMVLLLLALAAGIASVPAHAQNDTWKVDGEHSIARLSLGSGDKSVETGLGRVTGRVVFDTNDPADPVVELKLKPGKGQGASYSEISFKSKQSMLRNDGKVAVVGDLSVTRVERSVVTESPNLGSSDYYGGEYGEPVVHTDTREVTLLFPANRPAAQNGVMKLSVSTPTITREYFPELMSALASGNWPNAVVQDLNCVATTSGLPSEDYSGPACTGTTVATKTNAVASGTPGIGEGYYGFEPAVIPDGSQATIALELSLHRVASAAPTASNLSGEAGN
jgi:hypothetical protein